MSNQDTAFDAPAPHPKGKTSVGELLTNRFANALLYAMDLHRTQTRKGTRIPYVGHLLGVCSIVIDAGGNEDEAIAALLHDGPEDQGGLETLKVIEERFGKRVADIVEHLSDTFEAEKPPWRARKVRYLEDLSKSRDGSVYLVSAADKLHNLRSMLADYREIGESLWNRFSAPFGRVDVLWYHEALLAIYEENSIDQRSQRILSDIKATLEEIREIHSRGRRLVAPTDAKALAAERWFGYGSWDGPYWFVGKEPGGVDEPEQYASWLRLGGGELIGCRDHDWACAASDESMDWHGKNCKLQPTWRPLIALLLAYQGAPDYDSEAVRRYQDEQWGSVTGETAVLELSAVAAPSTAVEEALRLTHLEARIRTIRTRIAEHRPKFVVFYGAGHDPIFGKPYIERWSEIAGEPLRPNTIVKRDGTAYVATSHPTAHGLSNEFWTDLGRRLAEVT